MNRILVALTVMASATSTLAVQYFDDFEGYENPISLALKGVMNPPVGTPYSANWMASDGYALFSSSEAAWHIDTDVANALDERKYANMYGLPSSTGVQTLDFSITTGLNTFIDAAILEFKYLVQTSANLEIYLSANGGTFNPVAFTFTKRENGGQFEDEDFATIDLTPYLASLTESLSVRFSGLASGSSFSHIRIDDFNLTTTEVTTPDASSTFGLLAFAMAGLVCFNHRLKAPTTPNS
jgi:hypothetical protein